MFSLLTLRLVLQPGDHQRWKPILQNKKHVLSHGYFVTKQPKQADLEAGIDHSQARILEAQFFATQEPWVTEFAGLGHRFGTSNLQAFLAQKLTALIKTRYASLIIQNRSSQVYDLR
jgi:Dynamin central region